MVLQISNGQLGELRDSARLTEAKRLTPIMRKHLGRSLAPSIGPDLTNEIDRALQNGMGWGISERRTLTNFVILALLLGQDFHGHTGVKALLGTEAGNAGLRINALLSEFQWHLTRSPAP